VNDGQAIVVDASALVFLMVDAAGVGEWVADEIRGKQVFSSEMVHYEVVNQLRVHQRRKKIDATTANLAFQDLLAMDLRTEPFSVLANRIWELRGNVSAYDASYVALAEWRRIPLLTADIKLVNSPGPRCEFITPPTS
jgi:predicted nucleic acid-binding protein